MTADEATIDALKARVAELEGQIAEIIHDVGRMASEAEEDVFKDTGNTLDFDCGRKDGLEDAITTITTIAGDEAPERQCDVVGHSWQPKILEEEYLGSGLYIDERQVLRCRECGVEPHSPVYVRPKPSLAQSREGA